MRKFASLVTSCMLAASFFPIDSTIYAAGPDNEPAIMPVYTPCDGEERIATMVEVIAEDAEIKTVTSDLYSNGLSDSLLDKCGNTYAYNHLPGGEKGQKLYNDLLALSKKMWDNNNDIAYTNKVTVDKTTFQLNKSNYILGTAKFSDYGLTSDQAIEIYYLFKHDNPIFYFLSNGIVLSTEYLFCVTDADYASGSLRKEYKEKIVEYINSYSDCITKSPHESALLVHNKLNDNMFYINDQEPNDHNIIGAVIDKEGVCESYTRTYSLILNYYGINNLIVTGSGNGGGHAWNAVQMDDAQYYYVDCTWDDTGLTYNYFAKGTEAFKDHIVDQPTYTGTSHLYELPAIPTTNYIKSLETLSYTIDGMKFSGNIYDGLTLEKYSGSATELEIPSTVNGVRVSTINYQAFYNNTTLKSVTIPYTVIKILGHGAFGNCTNLETVKFEDNSQLGYLGVGCFSGCSKLKTVTIPRYLQRIDDGIFTGCSDLMMVVFEGSYAPFTNLKSDMFKNCTKLSALVFEDGMPSNITGNFLSGASKVDVYYPTGNADWETYSSANSSLGGCSVDWMPISNCRHKLSDLNYTPKTCTADGSYISKCSNCDSEIVIKYDDMIANGHVDADSNKICDVCGDDLDVNRIKLAGHSLSLNGNIGVNFFMDLGSDVVADKENYRMHFTLPNGSETDMPIPETTMDIGGKSYYMFSCAVAAKEMTDTITACMFKNGEPVSAEYKYTVKQYADTLLENADKNEEYAKAADMIAAMLNYGGHSQTYFGYNTDSLANSSLKNTSVSSVTAESFSKFKNTAAQNSSFASFAGANLVLESMTSLRLYFNVSGSGITFTCGGKTLEPKTSGGYTYVEIADIAAPDLDKDFIVTVSDGNSSFNVTYNVMRAPLKTS